MDKIQRPIRLLTNINEKNCSMIYLCYKNVAEYKRRKGMNYIFAKLLSGMISKLVAMIGGILVRLLTKIGYILFKTLIIQKLVELTFKSLISKIKELFPKAKNAVKRRFLIMAMDLFWKASKMSGKTVNMSELEKVEEMKEGNGVIVSEVDMDGEVVGENIRVIKSDTISQAVSDKFKNNGGYVLVEET